MSQGLKGGKLKYHSSKLEFLALKWAMTKQFKTDNNPLTYVMMMPNLDAIGHWWVAVMVGYNFEIEYMHGANNKVIDTLSWVGGCLDEDMVKVLLSHTTRYGIP